jgi:hypothetical protein
MLAQHCAPRGCRSSWPNQLWAPLAEGRRSCAAVRVAGQQPCFTALVQLRCLSRPSLSKDGACMARHKGCCMHACFDVMGRCNCVATAKGCCSISPVVINGSPTWPAPRTSFK